MSNDDQILINQTPIFMIDKTTNIEFITTDLKININTNNEQNTKSIFKTNFNFEEMGIGGLGKQFEIIFRRAFASRLLSKKVINALGVKHVRGIVLHGPPGCGKTLIARQIGKILNCETPEIVSGPSLLSSYHGQ